MRFCKKGQDLSEKEKAESETQGRGITGNITHAPLLMKEAWDLFPFFLPSVPISIRPLS